MKKLYFSIRQTFFRDDMELRVKLFHILAMAGAMICLAMGVLSAVTGMPQNLFLNLSIGLISLGLLFYSAKSGRYQFCYAISIFCIFFILFTSMFFTSGGYWGGMPFFFVFAVVYTVYMLDGWAMLFMTAFEIIYYSGLCVFAYLHPRSVALFDSELDFLIDLIVGFVTVSVALGATMLAQFRLYQKQEKKLEQAGREAEEANHAKSAFLANMSHEIRTPIHIVLGMNEIISRESRSRQVLQCSDRISEAGQMLLSLVDNVLDVSKIESGRMELVEEDYELKELTEIMTLIGRTRCEKKRISFSLEVEDGVPEALRGDVIHIKQIAGNLLSNAAKYTEKGSVKATISCIPEREGTVLLSIRIKDTGIGIRPEDQPALFDVFSRGDPRSTRAIEGSGLGLTIVKALTELMGGSVQVQSIYGKGSTFTVTVPQKIAKLPDKKKKWAYSSFLAPDAKILAVDDNEANCALMRTLLSKTRITVDIAFSGQECVHKAESEDYDLILLDYMMPGMDGMETLTRLQAIPGFSAPVVALTADASAGTEQKLLQAGFAAFLTKPTPWYKLEEVLVKLLPGELVTPVKAPESQGQKTARMKKLEDQLYPLGVELDKALEYFHDDFAKCTDTAAIFLKYGDEEQKKAEQLWKDGDYETLRYLVHALKGKAKNMGMERVGRAAEYMEELCVQKKTEEANCFMPYLLYLWRMGGQALSCMVAEACPSDRKEEKEEEISMERCVRELPVLLAQLRRKPSLKYLEWMMGQPGGENELLRQTRDAVIGFDFTKAEALFAQYLEEVKK